MPDALVSHLTSTKSTTEHQVILNKSRHMRMPDTMKAIWLL